MRGNSRSTIAIIFLSISLILGLQTFGSADRNFEEYTNLNMNFSTMLPRQWKSLLTQESSQNSLVFHGPPGTEEGEITLRFQVVVNRPQDTLEGQAGELEKIWSSKPGYTRLSLEKGRLAGQSAIRMAVSFQEQASQKIWKLEYFIAQRDTYFYIIDFEAPLEIFDKYRYIMDKTISTFRFIESPPQGSPINPRSDDMKNSPDINQ
jgi:hypothetical protein